MMNCYLIIKTENLPKNRIFQIKYSGANLKLELWKRIFSGFLAFNQALEALLLRKTMENYICPSRSR